MNSEELPPTNVPVETPMRPSHRRALYVAGFVALAAAIFLEQWCNFQSHQHPHQRDQVPPAPTMKG